MSNKQNFDKYLDNYAELICRHGLNIQKDQLVNISAEVVHRDLVNRVTKKAYEVGAVYVNVDYTDLQLTKIRLDSSSTQNFSYVPSYLKTKYEELVDKKAANLKIIGPKDPNILGDVKPEHVNQIRHHQRKSAKKFYEEGIGKSKIHWCVAAAATPRWAKNIFPDYSEEDAYNMLWDQIFDICRCKSESFLALWKKHNDVLQTRAQKLTNLKVESLKFNGPGTDLKVYLSSKAIFKGGGECGPYGVEFEPNLPTEEVFTTPDFRKTDGKVKVTRPFLVNSQMICGLEIEFKEGEIVHFSAEKGEETFKAYINSDPGAKRLGEVALVGIDSPVYRSGLVFEEILYDENAACHIAVGSAYRFCLENGTQMSDEEALSIGCNDSSVHTDMMISSEEVDVIAKCYDGSEVTLIKNGAWVGDFEVK